MELYKVNNDMSYFDSPYVKNSAFLKGDFEDAPLPDYESVKNSLPAPFWKGHESAVDCYNYAWKTAFSNLRKADGKSGFVSNFIDTAFNGFLFMWDSSFIVMFGKYGAKAFDFQKTLDNFYSHQHRDGFICREICESENGEHFTRHDPSSTGPNILAWSEWESYCQTGDSERLGKVFGPLVAYHLWLKDNHTWRDGTYWSTGWGCGMDNQPRLEEGYHVVFSHGHMVWADTCIQQILSAKILVKMAAVLDIHDSSVKLLENEITDLTKAVNEKLWDDESAFYYDLYKSGKLNYVKSVGAYWALIADIIPKDKLDAFVSHLDNEKEFKTHNRVPSLSLDNKNFDSGGDYWRGSIWAPTNYMVLKGLEKCGYETLAYDIGRCCLDNAVEVFEKTGTLWENYSPSESQKGSVAKSEFVGWSGLFPISIMLEYVFGIRPLAREKKIVWHVNLTDEHGVSSYPLGNITVDLHCAERKSPLDEPKITVISSEKITVELHYNGKITNITSEIL